MFLGVGRWVRKRIGPSAGCGIPGPCQLSPCRLVPSAPVIGSPFHRTCRLLRESCRPQGERPPRRGSLRRRIRRPFRMVLMGRRYPFGTTWDFHRSVSSAIVSRRNRQPPPRGETGNRISRPANRPEVGPTLPQHGEFGATRSAETRFLPDQLVLAPPSPVVAFRRWLHTPPRASSRRVFRTGTDPPG